MTASGVSRRASACPGATIDYEPRIEEYGVKEFGIQDLDGYDIAFGQDLEDL